MDFENLTRNELLVVRARCDEDLFFFTRFWFRVLRGTKFIVNWHHHEICNELKRIENYELELLNINIPPRFSKTEIAAVNFIARGIGMNPQSNWLYITASDELRAQTSVSIRDIVSHRYFKIMYGVELKKDQNAKNLWRTTQGGGLKTATISGQITGFGAGQMIDHGLMELDEIAEYIRTFEGCIVLDDINKTDDAEQENANNDKVTRVIFNTILSRKNSADTPIINIQQRSGMSDSTQQFKLHYKDNPKAKFLVYPVIYEGKPLWEWKHNMAQIQELKTSHQTAHVFDTQYMQDPRPKHGLLFPKEELNRYDGTLDMSTVDGRAGFIDVADKGTDSHSCPFGYLVGPRIYIHDLIFTTKGTDENVQMTADKINFNRPEYVRVESNFGGGMYVQLLTPLLRSDTMLLPVHAITNKHSRITTLAGFIKQFCWFRTDYEQGSEYEKFMDNLTGYLKNGESKHDDAPDSLQGLCAMIKSFYPHLYDVIPPEKEDSN